MGFRKLATAAALASALTFSSVSHAAVPVVASASEGKSDGIQGGLFGAPFFVVILGVVFAVMITKVTVDNSTSP